MTHKRLTETNQDTDIGEAVALKYLELVKPKAELIKLGVIGVLVEGRIDVDTAFIKFLL
jgi:hypothetical protein